MSEIFSNVINKRNTIKVAEKVLENLKDSLALSLGPFGSNAIIEGMGEDGHRMTKDGYTILKHIKFNDPIALTFLDLFRDMSADQVQHVGDGSTTTQIAAYYIYTRLKEKLSSMNERPKLILDECNRVVKDISKAIEDYSVKITADNLEAIKNVATIALNNDEELGQLIYEIYSQIGTSGFISNKLGYSKETYYEKSSGFEIQNGYLDKIFVNSDNAECKLKDTAIFMFDSFLSDTKYIDEIINVLNKCNESVMTNNGFKYKSILILAPDFGQAVKQKIQVINNTYAKSGSANNFCLVKYSLADSHYADIYFDLSAMCGANIIRNSIEAPLNVSLKRVEDYSIEELKDLNVLSDDVKKIIEENDLKSVSELDPNSMMDILNKLNIAVEENLHNTVGFAREIIVSQQRTILYDTTENEVNMQKIRSDINAQLQEMKDNNVVDLAKSYSLHKRLSILDKNLVTIFVGGQTEQERLANKDLIDDAISACKSALEYGYVPGCNITVIRAANELLLKQNSSDIYSIILEIMRDAFTDVYKEVLIKSKLTDTEIEEVIQKSIDTCTVYDLINNEYSKDRVINSVRTETEILKNVTSIVSLILTSNQFVTFNPRIVNFDI